MSSEVKQTEKVDTQKALPTKESFEARINDIVNRFNKNAEIIKAKTAAIDDVNKQIAELVDEQRRLQGEYRAVYNLGIDFGIIKDGEFIAPAKV